jgi:DNA-binding FadR family transcriptional regulator
MENLKINKQHITLVDQVEDKLLNYFKEHYLKAGSTIPNELELASALGVARSVLREALSRLKMMGMIESRTRRGMILTEPSILRGMERVIDPRILSEDTLFDILDFRIALEMGICQDIFHNITQKDIEELEKIVEVGITFENNAYAPYSEFSFHTKLYEITGNKTITEFQKIVHPVMIFVKDKFKNFLAPINIELGKNGGIVTHEDLLSFIKNNDEDGYRKALERHFLVYKIFMERKQKNNVEKAKKTAGL